MNDLTTINNNLTINSKEVADMVGKRHANLVRDIETYINYLGQNSKLSSDTFFIKSTYIAGTGKKYKCYEVTKKGCEFIANKLTGQKGTIFTAKYINRFHDMQDALEQPTDIEKLLYNPDTIIRIATNWKKEKEARIALEQTVEENKPKVIFADAVTVSKTSILVGELAKLLKQNGIDIGQNRLFAWMRQNGYLIKRKGVDYNMPTQASMNLELFKIKETSIQHSDGHITVNKTPKVTGKGQKYFINKFLSKKGMI